MLKQLPCTNLCVSGVDLPCAFLPGVVFPGNALPGVDISGIVFSGVVHFNVVLPVFAFLVVVVVVVFARDCQFVA
jgi:hypothetical protein